ncbi:radical SAM family heme chaperone HemW, partial [Thermodesulfobacteriota bacterium]
MTISIYIHIPFCLKKCNYCDFSSVAVSAIPQDDYTDCLIKEIDNVTKKFYDESVDVKSIYFGGGTPSLFNINNIERILKKVNELYNVSKRVEVTLEANPKSVDYDKLKGFYDIGINRLSLGAQSFDDNILKILGRVHDRADALTAYNDARRAGFENINLDLIFGVPTQSDKILKEDLKVLTDLSPEHISAYILTLEENTKLFEDVMIKRTLAPIE